MDGKETEQARNSGNAPNRHNYTFEDSGAILELSVYAVNNLYTIHINDQVMPLKQFLGIHHMYKDYDPMALYVPQVSRKDIYDVLCIAHKKDPYIVFTIPDTTVELLTMAFKSLEQDYKGKLRA